MKNLLIILLTLFIMSSPAYAKEVNMSEFQKAADTINSHAWFKGFFYIGSDDKFHHFVEKWDYIIDPEYEVSKGSLELAGEFNLGENEVRFSSYEVTGNRVLFTIGEKTYYISE